MKRFLPWVLVTLAIGCGPSEEGSRGAARRALTRDGFTAVTFVGEVEVDGAWDFTARREGQACEGTVVVSGRRTAAIQSRCYDR